MMAQPVIIPAPGRRSQEDQKFKNLRPAWSATQGPASSSPNEKQYADLC